MPCWKPGGRGAAGAVSPNCAHNMCCGTYIQGTPPPPDSKPSEGCGGQADTIRSGFSPVSKLHVSQAHSQPPPR